MKVDVDTGFPVVLSFKLIAPPVPSSNVNCAENGGPTVTPATTSIKYSIFSFAFLYPSILPT